VLDVAESVGVEIEWSCRSGTCGSCVVKLLSGEVSMEVEDGLDDEDRAAGMILACQARATSNIAVEA
jgi:ferredoxin